MDNQCKSARNNNGYDQIINIDTTKNWTLAAEQTIKLKMQ